MKTQNFLANGIFAVVLAICLGCTSEGGNLTPPQGDDPNQQNPGSTSSDSGSPNYNPVSSSSLYYNPSTSSSSRASSSSSRVAEVYGEICGPYCIWDTDCVRIGTDPDGFYGSRTATCEEAIQNCDRNSKGRYLNEACTAPAGSGPYCVDYFDKSCILMSTLASEYSACEDWAVGNYETNSTCPHDWDIYR